MNSVGSYSGYDLIDHLPSRHPPCSCGHRRESHAYPQHEEGAKQCLDAGCLCTYYVCDRIGQDLEVLIG